MVQRGRGDCGEGEIEAEEKEREAPPTNTRSGCHGKRRLYSVPEAPDMPDSEAFIDHIVSSGKTGELAEEVGACEQKGEEGEDGAHVTNSPSFLSPWQPEGLRLQLFGDVGRSESGAVGETPGKGKLRRISAASLTPSRFHSDEVGPSTSSPLPAGTPSLNHTHHTSTVTSSPAESSPACNKGIVHT